LNFVRYLGICILTAGCSTITYSGPRRPREEVATIRTDGTEILELDGTRWPSVRGVFEVLPGPHSLLVRLSYSQSTNPYVVVVVFSKYPQMVCFVAKPGRNYLSSFNELGGGRWEPRIFDQATLYWVSVRRPKPGQNDCLAR